MTTVTKILRPTGQLLHSERTKGTLELPSPTPPTLRTWRLAILVTTTKWMIGGREGAEAIQ